MKLIIISLCLLGFSLQAISAASIRRSLDDEDTYTTSLEATSRELGFPRLLTAIIQSEPFQEKVDSLIDLVDLKVRLLRLGFSLITTENLILLRRTLEWAQKVMDFVIHVLPASEEKSSLFGIVGQVWPLFTGLAGGTIEDDPINTELDEISSSENSLEDFDVEASVKQPVSVLPLDNSTPSILDNHKSSPSRRIFTTNSDQFSSINSRPTSTSTDAYQERYNSLDEDQLDILRTFGLDSESAIRLAKNLNQIGDEGPVGMNEKIEKLLSSYAIGKGN